MSRVIGKTVEIVENRYSAIRDLCLNSVFADVFVILGADLYDGTNLPSERFGTPGRELQRGGGRTESYVEKITFVQRIRRWDDSRDGCRDKVADQEEGGTGEAAAETRSASTASSSKCRA